MQAMHVGGRREREYASGVLKGERDGGGEGRGWEGMQVFFGKTMRLGLLIET